LKFLYTYIFLALLLVLGACSTKKDKFINRNFHALTTKFNVLYNGNLAFEEGREALINSYEDNFWEILPIERLAVEEEEIVFPGRRAKDKNFEIAEEKATKAIQKHSMNISGLERNPQMDEAFLLLGKARYFDQRFIPALEAFNYVLYKYPNSDKINTAKIWREKVNIRLENEQIAIKNLDRLLKTEPLEREAYVDLHAFMAQAYINEKKNDTAIAYLKEAAFTTKNQTNKARYLFILGQLYESLNIIDSSDMAFREILWMKRKAPRMYWAHAQIKMAEHFQYADGNDQEELAALMELAENRESRPYLDKIYYQIGQFHNRRNDIALAETFYNKALREQTPDKELKARTYQTLGDIYFDKTEYYAAGQYYDSTLVNMNETTLAHFRLKRKRDNLQDVIAYENTAAKNDSILNLVGLSVADRESVFQTVIDTLKARVLAAQKEAAEQEAIALDRENFLGLESQNQKPSLGAFQFYDPAIMGAQRMEFRRKWGNRNLSDNWRWQDRTSALPQTGSAVVAENPDEQFKDSIYQLAYYLNRIPKDPAVIDSLARQRNDAYYQLGLIYKERFKAYPVAIEKLEILLTNQPEDKLILPAKYNLYQLYELTDSPKASTVKTDILSNYANSRFAQLLQNPEADLAEDAESPEAVYNRIYELYRNQQFADAEKLLDEAVLTFNGDDIVPKLALLKARSLARLDGFEAYKKSMEELSVDYANSPEGKLAAKLLNSDLKDLEAASFDLESSSLYWKVLVPYIYADSLKMKRERETVEKAIDTLQYDYLFLSEDVYNRDNIFLVIHGFPDASRAEGFIELLRVNKDFKLRLDGIVVNSENYRIIQIHKNLDDYLLKTEEMKASIKN
jgi:tetratricopeptide (TPR) repeat protein